MPRVMKDSGVEWIGEIPTYWDCRKCKTILDSNDGGIWGDDPTGDGYDKVVIRSTEQTIDGKWCIENPALRDLSRVDYDKSRIHKNDLLITKSSGSDLHIGKTTLADDYFADHECYYSNFIQRISCSGYSPKLLWYLFNSPIIREQCIFLQNSTSGLGNINAGIIRGLNIPIPPLGEQDIIVKYLDAECAKIDAAIEKIQETIEEYKALKQSIITEAVTKGLRGDRSMKNSGIECIGEIPSEWEIANMKWLCESITDGSHFSPENIDDGYPYITAKDVHGEGIEYKKTNKISYDDYALLEKNGCRPRKGDVLLVKDGATTGRVGRMMDDTECVLLSSVAKLTPNEKYATSKYLMYLLMSDALQKQIIIAMAGSAMPRITLIKLVNFYGLVCPENEQQEIVIYLDEKCGSIEKLITAKQTILKELESYKKSLIFEYVTGKKEVV